MADIPQVYIDMGAAKVKKARDGFAALVDQFGGENIIRQITAAQKTELIGNAVKDVLYWGSTGSLWEAFKAVERMQITPEMAPFLTEEKRQIFKNKLIELISTL